MPTLTGRQNGTVRSDLFLGDFEDLSAVTGANKTGILDAVVYAFGGDDTVEGMATLAPSKPNLLLEATGIFGTEIYTGDGDDTVLARGATAKFASLFTDPRNDSASGEVAGNGLVDSTVYTGAGNDSLTFIGITNARRRRGSEPVSFGAKNAIVNSGSGADKITIEGETGILNTQLYGGSQPDAISIVGEGNGRGAIAAEQSVVAGGSEDDTITISASGSGSAVALRSTQVFGGDGNDTIDITSVSEAVSARNLPGSQGSAAEEASVINGGLGDDLITIHSSIRASGGAIGFGLKNAIAVGGEGNDTIKISVSAGGFGVPKASAVHNATVHGGSGDDLIELSGFGLGSSVSISAAENATIAGGAGNDTLIFRIGGSTRSAQSSVGLVDTQVFGGAGDDLFTVEVAQFENADRQPSYDIRDVLIAGGEGNDIFDVGIGSGRLFGGLGLDLAVIDYFDAETMKVRSIANGISITGTQTKSGLVDEWSQALVGIESFQIGANRYTAEGLVAEFAV